jgi:hypothetical protein
MVHISRNRRAVLLACLVAGMSLPVMAAGPGLGGTAANHEHSASGSSRLPAPGMPGAQSRPRGPQAAAEMNRTPIRVQPQNAQARLQAAMVAVDHSEQALKVAVNAMKAYLDREVSCMGKTWTGADMDQGCSKQDTLQACKEKLVAACAKGRGPGPDKLWSNVKDATADLVQKAQAVNSAYGNTGGGLLPGGGLPPLPPPVL